jgi:hypothetical protein
MQKGFWDFDQRCARRHMGFVMDTIVFAYPLFPEPWTLNPFLLILAKNYGPLAG